MVDIQSANAALAAELAGMSLNQWAADKLTAAALKDIPARATVARARTERGRTHGRRR